MSHYARIYRNGKTINLGSFRSQVQAEAAVSGSEVGQAQRARGGGRGEGE